MKRGWVYVLASRRNGTIYIGVTADLAARLWQHRRKPRGFAGKYAVRMLVHVEECPTIAEAIAREKAMKKWLRAWKIEMIERDNPDWVDLAPRILA
jgi:putative endonuclease